MKDNNNLPQPTPALPVAVLVSASVVLSLCLGLRNSLGLFLSPMAADLGITAGYFGFSLAMQNLVWGLAQPVVGALADRFGARVVLVGAACVYAAGLALMGTSTDVATGLELGGGVLVGIGVAGTGFGVLLGAVSRAVAPQRRSWAVGLVSAAGSLGTIVIAPLGQALIAGAGWRTAMLAFAAIAAAMGLASFGIGGRAAPGPAGQSGMTLRQALRDALSHPGFLMMTVAFFACGFQLTFIAAHLPGYLATCGLPPSVSATALALIGLFNAVGSYAAGWLGGRYNKSHLLASVYLLRTLGIVVYLALPVTVASTLVFASAMGLLWLSVAPLVSGLIGQMFGLRNFNALFGVVFFSHQLGSFAGAWLGGAIKDATGSYFLGWVSMVAIGLLAAAVQFPMVTRPSARLAAG